MKNVPSKATAPIVVGDPRVSHPNAAHVAAIDVRITPFHFSASSKRTPVFSVILLLSFGVEHSCLTETNKNMLSYFSIVIVHGCGFNTRQVPMLQCDFSIHIRLGKKSFRIIVCMNL